MHRGSSLATAVRPICTPRLACPAPQWRTGMIQAMKAQWAGPPTSCPPWWTPLWCVAGLQSGSGISLCQGIPGGRQQRSDSQASAGWPFDSCNLSIQLINVTILFDSTDHSKISVPDSFIKSICSTLGSLGLTVRSAKSGRTMLEHSLMVKKKWCTYHFEFLYSIHTAPMALLHEVFCVI